jgi:hypothetical protein
MQIVVQKPRYGIYVVVKGPERRINNITHPPAATAQGGKPSSSQAF